MINLKFVSEYCKEDPSFIENYNKAIIDDMQTWDCHHRLEIQGDEVHSVQELKELGLYYYRPACELIFLTRSEHTALHRKNQKLSDEQKNKIALSHVGKKKGKLSEETKKKISVSLKGKVSHLQTEESRRKIAEAKKGKKQSAETIQKRINTMKNNKLKRETTEGDK